jgi:hypothetical protein
MKQRWVNIHQRDARETSNEGNKFVKIIRATPCDKGRNKDSDEAKSILLPFDSGIVFSATRKEAGFHNTNGREEL